MKRIEMIQTDNHYTVIYGELFADRLGRDEALGCIASILYTPDQKPPYMKTYEGWLYWHIKYGADDYKAPVALLPAKTSYRGA